ncbi:MAG: hypothetical protein KME22_20975 [Hassallia sp. WJT32-NPBG1]|jgi:hypothetical protein|nr:hypothetical protein [Hassallia sp. WJT32-NPBG1]
MLSDRTDYLAAFDIIFNDYLDITRYIEPSSQNFKTFSHRIYAVYLRACTEFESVCKDILQAKGQRRKNTKIKDYIQIEPHVGLEDRDVGFHFWNPSRLYYRTIQVVDDQ